MELIEGDTLANKPDSSGEQCVQEELKMMSWEKIDKFAVFRNSDQMLRGGEL